jgi:phosphatidylglycerol:prolipoprotein diacylglycerol transferase
VTSAFIRLGNLMNSEIIGHPTTVPWAFVFVRIDSQPRHPAQLYESLFCFGVYFLMRFFYNRTTLRNKTGVMLGYYLATIFTFRFFIEFFKEDQVAKEATMSLNIGQLLSIPTVAIGIYLIVRGMKKGELFPYRRKS